ncbi:MAG: hypothetical protein ACOC1G_05175, partial [Phycisphaeraceae bacterium]
MLFALLCIFGLGAPAQANAAKDQAEIVPGDFNFDGWVTFEDAVTLARALEDPAAFAAAHPELDGPRAARLGDLDGNGRIGASDLGTLLAEVDRRGALPAKVDDASPGEIVAAVRAHAKGWIDDPTDLDAARQAREERSAARDDGEGAPSPSRGGGFVTWNDPAASMPLDTEILSTGSRGAPLPTDPGAKAAAMQGSTGGGGGSGTGGGAASGGGGG